VLAAGISPAWLAGNGVGIAHLRTPYGELSYSLRESGATLELKIDGGLTVPPGGLAFPWPYSGNPGTSASLDGDAVAWHGDDIIIRRVPAVLRVQRPR